jgi:hypothetical protein
LVNDIPAGDGKKIGNLFYCVLYNAGSFININNQEVYNLPVTLGFYPTEKGTSEMWRKIFKKNRDFDVHSMNKTGGRSAEIFLNLGLKILSFFL